MEIRNVWLVLLASLALVLLPSSIEITSSSFVDLESSSGNTFQAWASTQWVQTTQADFETGVLNQVDTTSSPNDVLLAPSSNWYDADWSYRREITIDHTKVNDVDNPSTTYANFPVLVHATGLSDILADGADIRFTASDGVTELPREIESYSSGTLYAWVKVTLTKDASDASDDTIYMYYGNASATEPDPDATYGSENVWDDNYKGVWHLNETSGGIAVDAVSSNTAVGDTVTVSHTTGSGANRLMLVGVGADYDGDDPDEISSITYNDIPLELVGSRKLSWLRIWIYKLVAPPTGTYDLVVTYPVDTLGRGAAGVMTFTGVDQTTPLGTFESATGTSGTTASVDVSSAAGELVFDTIWSRDTSLTVGAGQTERWNLVPVSRSCAGSTEPGAATTTMSWTLSATNAWDIGAVPIKPAPSVKDSTSNANHGTDSGSPTLGATGPIDGAIEFDGEDDDIEVADAAELRPAAGDFSVSFWLETTDTYFYIGKGTEAHDPGWRFYVNWTEPEGWKILFRITDNAWNSFNSPGYFDYGDNNPHHIVGVIDKTSNELRLYADGAEQGTATDISGYGSNDGDDPIHLSRGVDDGWYLDGLLDEVRISDAARSGDWIKTCYNNQSNPSAFYGVGTEETAESSYSSPGTIASQVLDTTVSGAVWNCLFWDETLQSSTNITFQVRASDTTFAKDAATPTWNDVGGSSPVNSGLPLGRYMQWRAILTASDTSKTPTLHEVRVYYY